MFIHTVKLTAIAGWRFVDILNILTLGGVRKSVKSEKSVKKNTQGCVSTAAYGTGRGHPRSVRAVETQPIVNLFIPQSAFHIPQSIAWLRQICRVYH